MLCVVGEIGVQQGDQRIIHSPTDASCYLLADSTSRKLPIG